jgi:hypothetical protein
MDTGSSQTSDTVGWCIDHSQYKYDPTGGSNNTAVWTRCDQIGIGSGGFGVQQGPDAVGFGCVSSATARAKGELMFDGKANFKRQTDLRLPYHRNMLK